MSKSWNNKDPMSYSGIQLDARDGTSYGMYIFSGWCNVNNDPTVTGLFLQSMQPPVIYHQEIAKLWRQTEFDWEFVPYTTSTFLERIKCIGTFPNAKCSDYLEGNQLGSLTKDVLAEKNRESKWS